MRRRLFESMLAICFLIGPTYAGACTGFVFGEFEADVSMSDSAPSTHLEYVPVTERMKEATTAHECAMAIASWVLEALPIFEINASFVMRLTEHESRTIFPVEERTSNSYYGSKVRERETTYIVVKQLGVVFDEIMYDARFSTGEDESLVSIVNPRVVKEMCRTVQY